VKLGFWLLAAKQKLLQSPGEAEQSLSHQLVPTEVLAHSAGSPSPPLPGCRSRRGPMGCWWELEPPLPGALRVVPEARKLLFFVSSKEKMIY